MSKLVDAMLGIFLRFFVAIFCSPKKEQKAENIGFQYFIANQPIGIVDYLLHYHFRQRQTSFKMPRHIRGCSVEPAGKKHALYF